MLGKLQGAMNDTAGWYTQQDKTLLRYTAINYLKHHLKNHSALLLTSGKQPLVAKTRRKKKKISEKYALPENPDFFSSLLLSIQISHSAWVTWFQRSGKGRLAECEHSCIYLSYKALELMLN